MASPKTIARLEGQIQRRVAHCLQFELADPRAGFITVTRVELATDLATARVFYSVLGEDVEERKSQAMLEEAGGFIRRQVASILRTRTVPQLLWKFDDSIREAARLDALIQDARRRDRNISSDPEEDDAPEDASPGEGGADTP